MKKSKIELKPQDWKESEDDFWSCDTIKPKEPGQDEWKESGSDFWSSEPANTKEQGREDLKNTMEQGREDLKESVHDFWGSEDSVKQSKKTENDIGMDTNEELNKSLDISMASDDTGGDKLKLTNSIQSNNEVRSSAEKNCSVQAESLGIKSKAVTTHITDCVAFESQSNTAITSETDLISTQNNSTQMIVKDILDSGSKTKMKQDIAVLELPNKDSVCENVDTLCVDNEEDGDLFVVIDSDSDSEHSHLKKRKKWIPVVKADPFALIKETLYLSLEEVRFIRVFNNTRHKAKSSQSFQ